MKTRKLTISDSGSPTYLEVKSNGDENTIRIGVYDDEDNSGQVVTLSYEQAIELKMWLTERIIRD